MVVVVGGSVVLDVVSSVEVGAVVDEVEPAVDEAGPAEEVGTV